eukprot:744684-Rhodomonas_salina.1
MSAQKLTLTPCIAAPCMHTDRLHGTAVPNTPIRSHCLDRQDRDFTRYSKRLKTIGKNVDK